MAWKVYFAILLVISTLVDYTVALKISQTQNKKHKKYWLLLSILTNLGILGYFKYANFFIENVAIFLDQIGLEPSIYTLQIILPMGISFYTFQTLGYTIDVYRGRVQPEKHLGYFALYVTYFPQLVAGPIERAENLLKQFKTKVYFNIDQVASGIRQIIWGLFKKVVIADRLALYVDQTYGNVADADGNSLLIASYLFAFQIYCDFSGYSDIAIGTARMFGVNLMDNFKVPYLSKSLQEFWSRWHISLSTWFRDYLYIPLGGNRVSKWRWYLNLMIVFVVSGFWHGAAWTFIIWGAIHGFILILENVKQNNKKWLFSMPKWFKIVLIFHIVVLGWVFFRAANVSDAFMVLNKIFLNLNPLELYASLENIGGLKFIFVGVILFFFVLFDPLFDSLVKGKRQWSGWKYQVAFSFMLACTIIFGDAGEVQFIYFQF